MTAEMWTYPLPELITRATAGDERALETLIERHQPRMLRLALTILGDAEEAADVTQDACLRIYEHIERFRGDSSFSTWTTRIVVNLCRSRMRRRKIIRFVSLGLIGERESGARVEREVARRQEHHELHADILRLKPKLRVVIVLRYYENYPCEAIASLLDIPIQTVYSRLKRARQRLRELRTLRGFQP